MFDLKKFENNTALITESSEISYRELADLSKKIGDAVNECCLVFLFAENSTAAVAGYIGFINRKIVPAMLDAELNLESAKKLIDLYRPKYLLLPKRLREHYADLEEVLSLDEYFLLSTAEKNPFPLNDELALLMTTSGSTGSPKFVRQSYENIFSNTKSILEYLGIDEHERAITNLPLHYVYGLSILNTHIFSGASLVLTKKTLFQKEFWQLMKEKEVTNFNGVPYTFEMLERLRFFRMKLPALKKITQAGGKLSEKLHFKFAEYAKENEKKFFVMYGAAEAAARMGYLPPEKSLEKIGCMGIAIPHGKFKLINSEGKIITSPETVGELIYYGDNVTPGYADKGEDLIKGDERNKRLETGDLAKFDADGFYTIVGRKKRFLKMFGKRINLQEVENILYDKFNLTETACGGKDDEMHIFVTDDKYTDEIISYLSSKINLHPTAFKVKILKEIPKNSAGKIKYDELEKF
ncbi:MAG: AMP-binding protein [Selenomonadaceae bacterium]|nr:AMP-binding protein [Selenomonadaceae bacterium]